MGDLPGHEFRGNQWTGGVRPSVVLMAPNKQKEVRVAQARASAEDGQRRLKALGVELPADTKIVITDHPPQFDMPVGAIAGTSLDGKTIMLNVGASFSGGGSYGYMTDKYWAHRADVQRALKDAGMHSTRDVDHALIHEVGHALFPKNAEHLDWDDGASPSTDMRTAASVSRYAVHSPHEFIAEVFAAGITGNLEPNYEVKELYNRLGGPHPEIVFKPKVKR